MVDRYTEWAEWTGWADEWADRRRRQGTGTDSADGNHNLAKVRVAGSNPVVRSISGLLSGHFLLPASHSQSHLTIPSRSDTCAVPMPMVAVPFGDDWIIETTPP